MAAFIKDNNAEVVIGAAIKVHRALGPGLLESTYQTCLIHEIVQRGLRVRREVAVPVVYEGISLDCGYRLDLLVEEHLIVEVKCVEHLMPIHTAQVLTYLRLTRAKLALLLNFNSLTLKAGLRTYVGQGNEVPKSQW
jgi:GxxExxY protein